jgi:Cu/Ag efflux protein CusF
LPRNVLGNPIAGLRKICGSAGASGKIGIKLSGAVGSGDATAPTQFKVQDGLWFNSVKPGDKISFSAQNANGVMTIQKKE